MTTHVDNLSDLKKTNHGVEIELNRYRGLSCKRAITETPLIPDALMARVRDSVVNGSLSISRGNDTALNFSHLVLAVTPTVAVGTPGQMTVEIINPNMEGVFQTLPGQTLTWAPGSGKPALMIFSMHHPLDLKDEVFRIRITNSGIPTKRTFCRAHAYWGVKPSLQSEYYKNEDAVMIDLDVGFRKSFLSDMKQVRAYANYVLNTSNMVSQPTLAMKPSVSVVPKLQTAGKAYYELGAGSASMPVATGHQPNVIETDTKTARKMRRAKFGERPLNRPAFSDSSELGTDSHFIGSSSQDGLNRSLKPYPAPSSSGAIPEKVAQAGDPQPSSGWGSFSRRPAIRSSL